MTDSLRVAVDWRGDEDHAISESLATHAASVDYEHRCAEHEYGEATLIYASLFGSHLAHSSPPAGSATPDSEAAGSTAEATGTENGGNAELHFAPIWMPVPRFPADSDSESTVQAPAAAHAIVWQAGWQEAIAQ